MQYLGRMFHTRNKGQTACCGAVARHSNVETVTAQRLLDIGMSSYGSGERACEIPGLDPLTPTLSPAAGERVGTHSLQYDSPNGERFLDRANGFPLPIRWGEGQGEGLRPMNNHG